MVINMKPKLLISAPCGGETNYSDAFLHFGFLVKSQYLPKHSGEYDGLVLAGGGDIDPNFYGQENIKCNSVDLKRDICEMILFDAFYSLNKPILGICRGIQLINVATGGTLYQDVTQPYLHRALADGTDNLHLVENIRGSFASFLWGNEAFVNSAHHQSCDRLGTGLKVCQKSPDGVVEAISDGMKVFGVQWHPERMILKHKKQEYTEVEKLFQFFKNTV